MTLLSIARSIRRRTPYNDTLTLHTAGRGKENAYLGLPDAFVSE